MTFFTSDVVVFGILAAVLGLVFYLESLKSKFWEQFFKIIPGLLLCYLIPALLNSFGVISSDESQIYNIAKNYFLPASLVLLTLSIDLKAIFGLGYKALVMFLAGTLGVIIGGPIALWLVGLFEPSLVADLGDASTWRGLATLAGSWIGGGANQAAMLEVFGYDKELYGGMVAVDIVVYNFWMALLIYGVGKKSSIDRFLGADNTKVLELQSKVEKYAMENTAETTFPRMMQVLGLAFGATALSHLGADFMVSTIDPDGLLSAQGLFYAGGFFWLVVIATMIGLLLSFTKVRKLEPWGASKFGSVFLYFLIAAIGMKIDILKTADEPLLLAIGFVWIIIHGIVLLVTAKLIKAPYFYLAVGSTANVGGAASAPVVAGAFHPSLATVGVLLAVLGYAAGTYGAILCANLMEMVSK
ncbi:MAG: DUF819 family protein [Candidatus Kapaibacteriales bacterium]